ncbi:retinol dehydrogenase 12 [Paraphoma chrysanthemicola]|uniref:Retinol dehydrogenase 12 n=1 Tax=Paraphoma chrysanthemicola TaxID=798071 RepID=A0A8K0RIX6_9PLEO|nr:retinol dehydrogenase 12 [Paraphoma chrysanthemicola]
MSLFNSSTSALNVAQVHRSRIEGKTILITGVASGNMGEATALAFAHGGASTIIITARDRAKLHVVTHALSESYPNTKFRPLMLNLSSLKAVQEAAKEIMADEAIPQLDYLVANAGVNSFDAPRTETNDGIEMHFGVNHLAHHLLIQLLLPKIKAAASTTAPGETRIVLVSSAACFGSPVRFSDWNYEKASNDVPDSEKPNWGPLASFIGRPQEPDHFEANIAYAQAKTANILTALQLNKILSAEGIYAFSLDPGYVDSNGAKAQIPRMSEASRKALGEPKTTDQGAATVLVAATSPDLKPEDGFYLVDCVVDMEKCPPFASDEVAAEKLWELSDMVLKARAIL